MSFKNSESPFLNDSSWTKEEIIKRYIRLYEELGVVPTYENVRDCSYLCHPKTISVKFGGFRNFVAATGLCRHGELPGNILRGELEKRLIKARVIRGRRLDCIEIGNFEGLPSCKYVRRVFGNIPLSKIWDYIEAKMSHNLSLWSCKLL